MRLELPPHWQLIIPGHEVVGRVAGRGPDALGDVQVNPAHAADLDLNQYFPAPAQA